MLKQFRRVAYNTVIMFQYKKIWLDLSVSFSGKKKKLDCGPRVNKIHYLNTGVNSKTISLSKYSKPCYTYEPHYISAHMTRYSPAIYLSANTARITVSWKQTTATTMDTQFFLLYSLIQQNNTCQHVSCTFTGDPSGSNSGVLR